MNLWTLIPSHGLLWHLWLPVPMRCSPRNCSQWVTLDRVALDGPPALCAWLLSAQREVDILTWLCEVLLQLIYSLARFFRTGENPRDVNPLFPRLHCPSPEYLSPNFAPLRKVLSLVQPQVIWFSAQGLTGCWPLTCIGLNWLQRRAGTKQAPNTASSDCGLSCWTGLLLAPSLLCLDMVWFLRGPGLCAVC